MAFLSGPVDPYKCQRNIEALTRIITVDSIDNYTKMTHKGLAYLVALSYNLLPLGEGM